MDVRAFLWDGCYLWCVGLALCQWPSQSTSTTGLMLSACKPVVPTLAAMSTALGNRHHIGSPASDHGSHLWAQLVHHCGWCETEGMVLARERLVGNGKEITITPLLKCWVGGSVCLPRLFCSWQKTAWCLCFLILAAKWAFAGLNSFELKDETL